MKYRGGGVRVGENKRCVTVNTFDRWIGWLTCTYVHLGFLWSLSLRPFPPLCAEYLMWHVPTLSRRWKKPQPQVLCMRGLTYCSSTWGSDHMEETHGCRPHAQYYRCCYALRRGAVFRCLTDWLSFGESVFSTVEDRPRRKRKRQTDVGVLLLVAPGCHEAPVSEFDRS